MHQAGRGIVPAPFILSDFSASVYSDVPLELRYEPPLAGRSVCSQIPEFSVSSHGDPLTWGRYIRS